MKRNQLEHVLRAAARIVDQRDFLVVGSAAILATFDDDRLPYEASRSDEADLAPYDDPDGGVSSATTSRQRSSPPAGTRTTSSSMRWWVPISSIQRSSRKGSSFCHVTECCPRTSPGRAPG
ncbi:MAG: hypothetical protein ACYDHH_33555 [Solirubrobacteraceae bacterium]